MTPWLVLRKEEYVTTSDYLTQWHEGRRVLLRASTYEAEGVYIARHLIPYFEQIAPLLNDLTPMNIHTYTRYKMGNGRHDGKSGGLSVVSVRKHLSILRQALDDAVLLGCIPNNPAASVRIKKRVAPVTARTVFLTADDAQRLLDGLQGHPIAPAVALALLYGLRRSEVLGLRWDAIDFEANTLTICRTVVKNLTIQESDETKTDGSRRAFGLLPEVRLMLQQVKGGGTAGNGYVFSHPDGTVWRPDSLTRTFQRQLARLNMPKMRFHDLRHSTASILFDRGWSLEDVKNWLGHSDIETTSNIYLHYGKTRKVLLAHDLEGMLKIGDITQKST